MKVPMIPIQSYTYSYHITYIYLHSKYTDIACICRHFCHVGSVIETKFCLTWNPFQVLTTSPFFGGQAESQKIEGTCLSIYYI